MILEEMWKIDNMAADQQGLSVEQQQALTRMEQTLQYDPIGKRYVTEMLFKNPDGPDTVNNYKQARAILQGLLRQMAKNPTLAREYDRCIQEFIDNGVLEEVQDDQPDDPAKKVAYCSHHAVINLDSATHPYRICWNPSL